MLSMGEAKPELKLTAQNVLIIPEQPNSVQVVHNIPVSLPFLVIRRPFERIDADRGEVLCAGVLHDRHGGVRKYAADVVQEVRSCHRQNVVAVKIKARNAVTESWPPRRRRYLFTLKR